MGATMKPQIPEPQPDEPDLTDKQLAFLRHLTTTSPTECTLRDADGNDILENLGTYQASAFIDQLIEWRNVVQGNMGLDNAADWIDKNVEFDDELDDEPSSRSGDPSISTRSGSSRSGDKLLVTVGAIVVFIVLALLFS